MPEGTVIILGDREFALPMRFSIAEIIQIEKAIIENNERSMTLGAALLKIALQRKHGDVIDKVDDLEITFDQLNNASSAVLRTAGFLPKIEG